MYAEASRFIGSSTNDGSSTPPRDNDGLPAQLRIVPLLNGSIKRIHIDMNDFARAHLAIILFPIVRLCQFCFPVVDRNIERRLTGIIANAFRELEVLAIEEERASSETDRRIGKDDVQQLSRPCAIQEVPDLLCGLRSTAA